MSTLHRSRPTQIETQSCSLKATWRVRAGSIDEPMCKAWLAKRVSPDKSVRLEASVTEDDAMFQIVSATGDTLNLLPIVTAANIEIHRVLVSQDDSGFVHAEVTGKRNGTNIVLLRASRLANATSGTMTNSIPCMQYAVTQLWSVLQVPGGRYELARE